MKIQELQSVTDFFSYYPARKYKKGQIFVLTGEHSEYIYLLLHGRVKVYAVSYRGDEVALHIYTAPAIFPISHAVLNDENRYIYEAESDVTVQRSPLKAFREFIKSDPIAIWTIVRELYVQIEQLLRKEFLLIAGDARSRLIYELIIECQEFGINIHDDAYKIDVREREIGTRVGMTRETVNREAKKLEHKGLITLEYMTVIIPSLSRLRHELSKVV